ncbi:MAG: exodeoxyribonuclease VII small subunit [Phycisphaeraceae bacterium]|nr:exodeoxyribonuclease VII small subunit [Phycisphaerales bacterium]MCB9861591.1 exodeoxyribonuclease VII small subunit [Phycisphaeraceae bacterium]
MAKKSTKPADTLDPKDMSFEQAMAELEDVVQSMESEVVSINHSIDQYNRGVQLVSRCKELLGFAEQRFEEIKKQHESANEDDD